MSDVLLFSEIGAADLPRVGGKGANLGEMARAGFPVPGGFCVTTAAYRAWLTGAPSDVFAPLVGLSDDLDAVRSAGERVRAVLSQIPLPEGTAKAVLAAWRPHGEERPFAVRSSATAEDLPDASFAGQQDTYLNLIGAEAILDGVRRCWISLFTDRAILYRNKHAFRHEDVALSVVVQRMVLPDVAGILFTADPMTHDRFTTAIDAGFGLGEALVSGKVSADLFHVDKRTGKLRSKRIADKRLRIVPIPTGGTIEEELPESLRTRPSLTDAQAEALAALGQRIETHYGRPQDIEWCLEGDVFSVVQARPITTLHPLPKPGPPDGRQHLYLSWGHIQGMTNPIPELARSLLMLVNPFGKDGKVRIETTYMVASAGRLYHDATDILSLGPLNQRLPKAFIGSDPLLGRALGEAAARPGFMAQTGFWQQLTIWASAVAWLGPLAAQAGWYAVFGVPEGRPAQLAAELDAAVDRFRAALAAAEPGVGRLRIVHAMMGGVFGRVSGCIPWIFSAFIANDSLRALHGEAHVETMLRAMPGNVVIEKDLAVARLAELARPFPALVAALRERPADVAAVAEVEGGSAFVREWTAWMAYYGARAASEVDASHPRYSDEPAQILAAVLSALDGAPRAQLERHAALARDAEAAIERMISASGGVKRALTRRFTRVGRNVLAARELPKFHGIRCLGLAREVVLAEGARLAADGVLAAAGDVWFFDLDELIMVSEGRFPEAAATGSERRAAFAKLRTMTPPRVFTSDGEQIQAQHDTASAPAGALVGTSASSGVVEGRARVIFDPATATLQPGDILVAPFTDPGWTPLFAHAAGLVMEVGGQMTHGSVVAREYGIPAVVCVPNATTRIREGERIRVDGNRGFVERLEAEV